MRYLIEILTAASAAHARRDAAACDKTTGDKKVPRQSSNWPTDCGCAPAPTATQRVPGDPADSDPAARASSTRPDPSAANPNTGV
ncbi:MAG TPA: hypothetical protein VHY91_02010 [Pirellulales bacterium]|jgi:hypothetical protein|nr:hypothetical protein [Pirellulales bacterium]